MEGRLWLGLRHGDDDTCSCGKEDEMNGTGDEIEGAPETLARGAAGAGISTLQAWRGLRDASGHDAQSQRRTLKAKEPLTRSATKSPDLRQANTRLTAAWARRGLRRL